MVMTMNDMVAELKTWTQRNPLRVWRAAENVKATNAAVMLSVSNYTINVWENGSSYPSDASFDKVERLIGRDMRDEWRAWMDQKPN